MSLHEQHEDSSSLHTSSWRGWRFFISHTSSWRGWRLFTSSHLFMKRMKRMKILHLFTPLHEEDEDSSSLHTSSWRGWRLFIKNTFSVSKKSQMTSKLPPFIPSLITVEQCHWSINFIGWQTTNQIHEESSCSSWRVFILFILFMKSLHPLHEESSSLHTSFFISSHIFTHLSSSPKHNSNY